MPISVLLVEDDFDLAETVVQYLELEEMLPDHAYNGTSGLDLALKNNYDVIVLDIMLPHLDGLSVCDCLRRKGKDTPVIMLTARDTLDDKLAGFRAGTDDYLVKPFEMAELVARIKALASRKSNQSKVLKIGDLSMNLENREVHRGDLPLKLTPTCWELLEIFMREYPNVVSKAVIEKNLWGDEPPETNNLKVHLHKLRQQLNQDLSFNMIKTVPGHGFVLSLSE